MAGVCRSMRATGLSLAMRFHSMLVSTIAGDTIGHAYIAGKTGATDFPVTPGSFNWTKPASGFVAKLSADGSSLMYSTFLGGSSASDNPTAIAVDANGSAYVTGVTL